MIGSPHEDISQKIEFLRDLVEFNIDSGVEISILKITLQIEFITNRTLITRENAANIHENLDFFAISNTRAVGEANYADGIIVAIDDMCQGQIQSENSNREFCGEIIVLDSQLFPAQS